MNMEVWLPCHVTVFVSFGYIPRRIAESYGSSNFNFFWNLHTVFLVAAPVYSPTNRAQVLSFLHIHANTCYLFFVVGFDSVLTSSKYHTKKTILTSLGVLLSITRELREVLHGD